MVRAVVPPPWSPTAPVSVDVALQRIREGKVKVFTSDVFDTLVWRPVAAPDHLFLTLGQHLLDAGHLQGWVSPAAFAEVRRVAERRARERNFETDNTYECTLTQIWDQVPAQWWMPGAEASTGVTTELAVEAESLHLQPVGNALLEAARSADCRIALVSDTYFEVDQLRLILENAGIDLDGIEVHTSAGAAKGKWGGLLADVVGKVGSPEAWLHIGDNLMADVIAAESQGATACWLDVLTIADQLEPADHEWMRFSLATGADGGRQAVLRETLIAAGEAGSDPSYQFGAGIAGPMIGGFAGWASMQAEHLGAERLHCLLREGGRIAELIQLVRPDGPATINVHASRWAMMRAAVIDGNPKEISRALGRRGPITSEFVESAFGVDAAKVAAVLGSQSLPQTERTLVGELLSADDEVRAAIVEAAAAQRANVVRYLERTLDPGDGPLVLCDIGWGGSIQEAITDILRSAGRRDEVIGLYLLLSPAAVERRADGARIESFLPRIGATGRAIGAANTTMRNPEFLERITTPPIGTLLEFDTDGQPVCRPDGTLGPSLELGQRGVIDFCQHLGTMATHIPALADFWFDDPRTAEQTLVVFSDAISLPNPALREALGSWEHDDVAGADAEVLTNPAFARWGRYLSANDARSVPMSEAYWVNGALSDAVNAQLKLLNDGLDPTALERSSNTGTARLSAFAPGSELAVTQVELVPTASPDGWMTISLDARLDRPYGPLRGIRFDPASVPALVEVADAKIVLTTASADVIVADGPDGWFASGDWVNGRSVSDQIAISGPGGHFVIPIDADTVGPVESIWIRIAFRTRPVPASLAAANDRWKQQGRRAARLAKRAATSGAQRIRDSRQTG